MIAEPVRLALLITTDPTERRDYWRASLAVVTLADDGTPRNLSDGYHRRTHPDQLADLVIEAQADPTSSDLYGWRTAYRSPYAVELADAEAMTRTMRGIARHLDKLTDRYGAPADFPAYAARVADALHITTYLTTTKRAEWYSDGEYRTMDTADALYHLRDRHAQYRAACRPAEAITA
jgi:hypothetical protein